MKSRLFQNRSLFKGLAITASWVFLGIAVFAWAYDVKDDREVSNRKPVNISAFQLTFDRNKGLTLFTGDVKARHDQVILIADEIRAFEENKQATANGHVHVVDTSQGITLTCGNLEYQDMMDLMTAHDHPVLTTLDEDGRPLTVSGRQMELDSEQKTVVVNQNVEIHHPTGHAEAQKATFLSKEDKFILEDDPKVYTDNGLLSGRRIVSYLGGDRGIMVEGMADAIFNPNGKPVTGQPVTARGGNNANPRGSNGGASGSSSSTPAASSASVTNPSPFGNNGPAAPGSGPSGTMNPVPVRP